MKPWTWFDSLMFGSAHRQLSGAQKLKVLAMTIALGVTLGIVMVSSGVAGIFVTTGIQQAGLDPRTLYSTYANPATATNQSQPAVTLIITPSPAPLRGGWINPQP